MKKTQLQVASPGQVAHSVNAQTQPALLGAERMSNSVSGAGEGRLPEVW